MVWSPSVPPEWVVARPCEGGHQLQAASPPPGWGINAGTPAGAPPSGQWDMGWPLPSGMVLHGPGRAPLGGWTPLSNSHLLSQHMKHTHKRKLGRIIYITNWSIVNLKSTHTT